MILLMSAFVAAQGNTIVQNSTPTVDNAPLESATEDTGEYAAADNQEAKYVETSQYDSESSEFPSSTIGSKIDQLRLKVTPPAPPQPPPDEVLYIDGFTNTYGVEYGWNYEGSSPYLDAAGDGEYIWSDMAEPGPLGFPTTGKYGFQNTTLDRIGWGRIEAYAQWDGGGSDLDADLYIRHGDAGTTTWVGSIEAGTAWSWVPTTYVTEIPSDFLTPADVNSMTLRYIMYWTPDGLPAGTIQIDAVRLLLWRDRWSPPSAPERRTQAMKDGELDVVTNLPTVAEIDALNDSCFTITSALGFHMGLIGYNIRDLASTERVSGGAGWKNLDVYNYRSELIGAYWPLAHVEFRHALVHCYDQLGIIPPIYGYTVTAIRSLVPPAQSKYYNPSVLAHPYNPGNPFTTPAGDGSTVGILKLAGYTFVDADSSGTVTDADYWKCPDGTDMPHVELYTPLIDIAPTSFQHGLEFVNDLTAIGLGATTANGNRGFEHKGFDFNEYLSLVYGTSSSAGGQFDAFMIFYSLGKLPDQLYSLLHSSGDSAVAWQMQNSAGVNDATIDALCNQVKYSLDVDVIEAAAKSIQDRLYNPTNSYALAYMTLYSRTYFNAFNSGIRGIVNSPGFGSNNMWTFLNMRWQPGHPFERIESGKSTIIWCIDDYPESFSPLYASDTNAWTIMDRVYDSLTAINPYNHRDIPWLASSWSIEETADGMTLHFTLRSDIQWQDGKPFTATDAAWCLEFLRDWAIPIYWQTSSTLVDAVAVDATHLDIYVNEASLSLFYDFSGLAAYLPKHIWDRSWASLQAILDYDTREAYNVAPGYSAGPHPPPTNLFGTGPFTFQFYDPTNGYSDLWRNEYYFMSQASVQSLMTEMFWEVGDTDRDGVVEQDDDYDHCSMHFGYHSGEPGYDPDCDFNQDGTIDMIDVTNVYYHLQWRLEYPEEIMDVAILDATSFPTVVYPGQEINITIIAKNRGNTMFTTNFTYYYGSNFIGSQTYANLIPCHNTSISCLWDTTGVTPGTYTISANASIIAGTDANPADNTFTDGTVKIGTTKIAVDPHKSIVGSAGKDFTINVTIADAPYNATWAWEFRLNWNVSLLNITDVEEGAFLSQNHTWATAFANFTNQVEGWVLISCTLTDDPIGLGERLPDGNGTLATISFTVLDLGSCALHLSDSILLNYDINPYYHTTEDGEFKVHLGDVDRDGIVDDEDIRTIKLAYGALEGSPNWNPEADIWGPEGKPDGFINVYDLAMCGKRYGDSA